VIREIEDEGKLDHTLMIYIVGDNGTIPKALCSARRGRMAPSQEATC
jgi:hypothetical protein